VKLVELTKKSYTPIFKVLQESKISKNLLIQQELGCGQSLGETSAFSVVEKEVQETMKNMESAGLNQQVEKLKAELEKAKSEKWTFKDIALGGFLAIPMAILGIVILPVVVVGVVLDGVVRLLTLNNYKIIDY